MTRTQGPKSFAALDVGGAFASPVKYQVDRPARTWTRTWMTNYFWVGLGGLFLGGQFLVVGVAGNGPGAAQRDSVLAGSSARSAWCLSLSATGRITRTSCTRRASTGRATIVGVTQTGMWANNNPVTVPDCKIHVDGHPDHEVRQRETVPQVAIGQLTRGATLPVKVNPKNPSDFIFQWEQL